MVSVLLGNNTVTKIICTFTGWKFPNLYVTSLSLKHFINSKQLLGWMKYIFFSWMAYIQSLTIFEKSKHLSNLSLGRTCKLFILEYLPPATTQAINPGFVFGISHPSKFLLMSVRFFKTLFFLEVLGLHNSWTEKNSFYIPSHPSTPPTQFSPLLPSCSSVVHMSQFMSKDWDTVIR